MSEYVLVIDEGTTSTRACLLGLNGSLVAQSSEPFEQHFPQPGWVEHDAEEIWMKVKKTIEDILKKGRVQAQQVKCIGITNQRETVVAWDRHTARPLAKAIVWQCRRTASLCAKLKSNEKKIQRKTGLVLDPYFSGTKMRWLLENNSEVKQARKDGRLCFGTIDSFLIFKLTQGKSFFTDVSNASRTMLMNLDTLQWDEDLLRLFKVPRECLPAIRPSNDDFGHVTALENGPFNIPIHGVLGDQQAALFGQAGFQQGDVKCTFGTGSFILFNTGSKKVYSKQRLLTTVAWQLKNQKPSYALEGGAFVCGAAVQWLRDGLNIIQSSGEVESLAASVSDSGGVEFVPALTGLGAPHWNSEAKGLITGLTRGSTKAHIARATLEAMALQNVDILKVMERDLGRKLKALRVDGGATQNSLLLQLQSDYLQREVIRPQELETTALGVGLMAGLGAGLWKNLDELKKLWKPSQSFRPKLSTKKVKDRILSWDKAIKAAKSIT